MRSPPAVGPPERPRPFARYRHYVYPCPSQYALWTLPSQLFHSNVVKASIGLSGGNSPVSNPSPSFRVDQRLELTSRKVFR